MVLFAKAFGHYPLALTFQEGHLKRAAPGSGKTLTSTIRYSSVTRATSLFSRLFFSKEITFTHSPSPGFDLGLIFFSLISINSYYHDVCGTVWQTRIDTYSWRTFSNITFIASFSLKLPKSSCFGTLSSVTPAGNSRQQPPIGGQTASPERYVHNEENVSFPRKIRSPPELPHHRPTSFPGCTCRSFPSSYFTDRIHVSCFYKLGLSSFWN